MQTRNIPQNFTVGARVELHPATDLWMRGARFGTVRKVTATRVHVDVDRLGRVIAMHADNLLHA